MALLVNAISATDSNGKIYMHGEEFPAGDPYVKGMQEHGLLHDSGGDVVAEAPDGPDADGDGLPDPIGTPTADLASAIEKANAPDVVAHAQGDPARAEALLKAEEVAQGGDGRKTVVQPLQKIIDDAK